MKLKLELKMRSMKLKVKVENESDRRKSPGSDGVDSGMCRRRREEETWKDETN